MLRIVPVYPELLSIYGDCACSRSGPAGAVCPWRSRR